MRSAFPATRLVAVLMILAVTPALAWGEGAIVLVHARMDQVFELPDEIGPIWDFTFTIRNEGRAQHAWIYIDEAPIVFDLPFTQWSDEPFLEAGEEREIIVRIDWSGGIAIVPADWLCLRVDGGWPYQRCWSVLVAPGSGAVYPEDIPHWQLTDVQYGDGPQG